MKHRNWDTAMAMHQILMSRINGKNNNLVLCLHESVLNKYYIKKKKHPTSYTCYIKSREN